MLGKQNKQRIVNKLIIDENSYSNKTMSENIATGIDENFSNSACR